MEHEYNIEKSRSLNSCKSPLQKKEKLQKEPKKGNFLFTDENDDIDSYSNADQTNTVKVMVRSIFWFCRYEVISDSSNDDWTS